MRQRLPKLDRMAAMPSRIGPSIVAMSVSFSNLHVPRMFSCRTADSAFIHLVEAFLSRQSALRLNLGH